MNKEELIRQMAVSYKRFSEYIKQLDEQQFSQQRHGKWSPAQQLEHLTKSVHQLNIGLGLPKIFIRIVGGRSKGPSRTYEQLVRDYQNLLKNGATASAKYIPGGYIEDPKDALCNYLEQNAMGICDSLTTFTEEQLDKMRLPHPLMGKLTIREMIYFTIYHANHHLIQTKTNLER